MERKIGEIFEFGDKSYKVVEVNSDNGCDKCDFVLSQCSDIILSRGYCHLNHRVDKKDVIFKLVDMCKNKEEKRNVELTLNKAKEWYKKGGELKEVALQAFNESELKDSKSHSWDEFYKKNHKRMAWHIYDNSNIDCINIGRNPYPLSDKILYPTKEYAEAALALAQLLQLRQEWIGDWEPNWEDNEYKYTLLLWGKKNNSKLEITTSNGRVLSFPTFDMAKEFLNDFRELLEQAKPLL